MSSARISNMKFPSSEPGVQLDDITGRPASADLAAEILSLPGGQPGGHLLARQQRVRQLQRDLQTGHHPQPQPGQDLHGHPNGPEGRGQADNVHIHSL